MTISTCPFTSAIALTCSSCKKAYPFSSIQTFALCCNQPLVVTYNYSVKLSKASLLHQPDSLWRYAAMLPVIDPQHIVTLGEGMTPVYPLHKMTNRYGLADVLLKDESCNPTGSFKARGLSVAVSKAKELGITKCIIPTAGNAGGALAAYCANAGIGCTVVMPRHTPAVFKQECLLYGANLVLVDGLIHDCAQKAMEINADKCYFDVSTLKEPYRLEGKKTMGYEIAEQLNWQLPDVIIYPAGGGTGLIGIWKAFKEMQLLGWIDGPLPRMIAVQSAQCAPLLYAQKDIRHWKSHFTPQPTIANGLAVPYPFGMTMMLAVLNESGGMALALSEAEIIDGVKEIARNEGLLIAPEGAATWKAYVHLSRNHAILPSEKVLLLNTGSGYKYLDNYSYT